jgi:PhnB protein
MPLAKRLNPQHFGHFSTDDRSSQMSPSTSENTIQEVFPYLIVRDAAAAIEFYKRAFGAQEIFRLSEPSGRIGHAELKFGPATVMLADEFPEYGISAPPPTSDSGSSTHLHVADVDAMTAAAREAGAKVLMEPTTQFYGERASRVRDPFGHIWLLGQHIEDVAPEEMQRRYTQMFS